jgi:hypothetical protein
MILRREEASSRVAGEGDREARAATLESSQTDAGATPVRGVAAITGCGKSALFVILSEAKNLSWFKTQD